MYRSITLEEDLALKETVANRFADKSSAYAWRDTLDTSLRAPVPEIVVTRAGQEENFSLADVADAIGESLTDLLISRNEPEDAHLLRERTAPSCHPSLTASPPRSCVRSSAAVI